MNSLKNLFALLLALAALTACNDGGGNSLMASKGLPCELLVVCDPRVTGSDLMDSVKTVTECECPGLGTAEDIFRVNNISQKAYTSVFWSMHSKIFFSIDPKLKEPRLGVARDVKSRPQLEIHVEAPDEASMRSFIAQKREAIQELLIDFQTERLGSLAQNRFSKKVDDDLAAVAGYSVRMPSDMVATKKGENFLWGGSNRSQQDINFIFYTYPWNGQDIADVSTFVSKRDSVLKANIPGSRPDQHMVTSRGLEEQPVVWPRLRRINGELTLQVRGLWELENGFLGGPFSALVSVDSAENKVVVREGFVYNPEGQKRDLMRQLEGSLLTLRKQKSPNPK